MPKAKTRLLPFVQAGSSHSSSEACPSRQGSIKKPQDPGPTAGESASKGPAWTPAVTPPTPGDPKVQPKGEEEIGE